MVDKAQLSTLNAKRQAGELQLDALREKPRGFRLDSCQGASNELAKQVDDLDDLTALELFDLRNIPQSYKEGNISVIAQFVFVATGRKCQLVFRATPSIQVGMDGAANFKRPTIEGDKIGLWSESYQTSVFVILANFVQNPETVVPSIVRLGIGHNGQDVRSDFVLGASRIGFESRFILAEGERDAHQLDGRIHGQRACTDGLVQRVPEIVEGVGRYGKQFSWDGLTEPPLTDIVSHIRVIIDDIGLGIVVEESLTSSIKLVSVFPSAIQE